MSFELQRGAEYALPSGHRDDEGEWLPSRSILERWSGRTVTLSTYGSHTVTVDRALFEANATMMRDAHGRAVIPTGRIFYKHFGFSKSESRSFPAQRLRHRSRRSRS